MSRAVAPLPAEVRAALAPHEVDLVALPDLPRTPDGRIDLDRLHAGLGSTLLESAPGAPATGRFSYVVASAAGRLVHDGRRASLSGVVDADLGHDAFAAIDAVAAAIGATPDADRRGLPPLSGGLVGAWSYDLGRLVEMLPSRARDDRRDDWLDLLLVDAVVAVDHDDETAWLVRRPLGTGRELPDESAVTARAKAAEVAPLPTAPDPRPVTTTLARSAYLDAVRAVLARIAAGEVFQVNVTQRLTAPWDGDAAALYRALRARSHAPFGAVHHTRRGTGIASISPETFLAADARRVTTRPIKGTRPRGDSLVADLAFKHELAASEKDRAENVMVVDMERNDLGRVCVPGSVTVPDLLSIEGHPTVWQLVSTVIGRLRDDVGYGALLRAAFPCGSVTGTPKVRAMEVIDALEPVRRSWYCGAVGFVAPGAMSTSVAIRTAVVTDGLADYAAGGGIVADSDPEAEHRESLDKADAFLRAVGGTLVAEAASQAAGGAVGEAVGEVIDRTVDR